MDLLKPYLANTHTLTKVNTCVSNFPGLILKDLFAANPYTFTSHSLTPQFVDWVQVGPIVRQLGRGSRVWLVWLVGFGFADNEEEQNADGARLKTWAWSCGWQFSCLDSTAPFLSSTIARHVLLESWRTPVWIVLGYCALEVSVFALFYRWCVNTAATLIVVKLSAAPGLIIYWEIQNAFDLLTVFWPLQTRTPSLWLLYHFEALIWVSSGGLFGYILMIK